MILFKYNNKKIILALLVLIALVVFFGYLFFDAENLSSQKPTSFSRNRFIGELLFKNEILIKSISIIILLISAYTIISFIKILISKNVVYENRKGFFYQDNKLVVEISKIDSVRLKKINNNYFMYFYLKNVQQFMNDEPNLLLRIKYKLSNFTEGTPLILNINYLKSKPEDTLIKLRKLIKK